MCTKIRLQLGTATDNCDPNPSLKSDANDDMCFQLGTTEVWNIATDASGNESKCGFYVTVKHYEDKTAPRIKCPADVTKVISCTETCGKVSFNNPTATDDCDVNPEVVVEFDRDHCYLVGTTEVWAFAKDKAGNEANCAFNVTISMEEDVTAPTIQCPKDIVLYADCGKCAKVPVELPTAEDNCDPRPQLRSDLDANSCFEIGVTEVWCFAKDRSGNISQCGYNVTVKQNPDTEAPKLKCPADVTLYIDCNEDCTKARLPLGTATDNCDPNPSLKTDANDDQCYHLGTTEIWNIATDASGNESKCGFYVNVKHNEDRTDPSIKCPADITKVLASCDETCIKVSFNDPTATDDCDANPEVVVEFDRDHCYPIGTTEVWAYAKDKAGNKATCSFDIIVKSAPDEIAPNVRCPKDVEVIAYCDRCAKVPFELPTATDNCDPNPQVRSDADENTCFEVGTTEVWGFAKDASGNQSKCSYNVTVKANADTEAPELKCPADVTVYTQCNENCAKASFGLATATDNCDQDPQIRCDADANTCFEIGTTEVWYLAKDAAGNQSKCGFNVIVKKGEDTEAPVINCPKDIYTTIACNEKCAKITAPDFSATDNCDQNPDLRTDIDETTCFELGTTEVWAFAKDRAGNQSKCAFNVIVTVGTDKKAPTITCPSDVYGSVDCNGATCAKVNFALPKASDDCDPNPKVWCENQSGECFKKGTTTVKCWAKDAAGNESNCSFNVIVKEEDKIAPVIKCRDNVDLYVDCGCEMLTYYVVDGSNCNG